MPSAENARNFSKGRWLPFIDDCKPLKDQCPLSAATGRVDSDKITNMRQEFLSCTLTFAGAGSENNVKSAPVAYLVLDEIDEEDADLLKQTKHAFHEVEKIIIRKRILEEHKRPTLGQRQRGHLHRHQDWRHANCRPVPLSLLQKQLRHLRLHCDRHELQVARSPLD